MCFNSNKIKKRWYFLLLLNSKLSPESTLHIYLETKQKPRALFRKIWNIFAKNTCFFKNFSKASNVNRRDRCLIYRSLLEKYHKSVINVQLENRFVFSFLVEFCCCCSCGYCWNDLIRRNSLLFFSCCSNFKSLISHS